MNLIPHNGKLIPCNKEYVFFQNSAYSHVRFAFSYQDNHLYLEKYTRGAGYGFVCETEKFDSATNLGRFTRKQAQRYIKRVRLNEFRFLPNRTKELKVFVDGSKYIALCQYYCPRRRAYYFQYAWFNSDFTYAQELDPRVSVEWLQQKLKQVIVPVAYLTNPSKPSAHLPETNPLSRLSKEALEANLAIENAFSKIAQCSHSTLFRMAFLYKNKPNPVIELCVFLNGEVTRFPLEKLSPYAQEKITTLNRIFTFFAKGAISEVNTLLPVVMGENYAPFPLPELFGIDGFKSEKDADTYIDFISL